jgi:hypothetical protein
MKTHVYKILVVSALCLAVAALAVSLWTGVRAQESSPEAALAIPTIINYQGTLRNIDGSLINDTLSMTFRLYNDLVGGSPLYEETIEDVNVRDSLFTVLIGDTKPIDPEIFKGAVYVGVRVGSDAEMAPRQRLAPVAYAVQLTDGVFVDRDGKVGIGNQDPQAQMDVSGDAAVSGNISMGSAAVGGNATVGGDLTVTGDIARDGETSIGPHYFDPIVVIKPWGSCGATSWLDVDLSFIIPDGATAVILEYQANMHDNYGAIKIRKGEGSADYYLAAGRADGSGDENGWGGQGTFPITEDGTFQYAIWDYGFDQDCLINAVGYYK